MAQLEIKGKLFRVKKEVDIRYEIAAGIRKSSDTNGPALLFENVTGYPDWRVAGGLYATKELMAFALETDNNESKMMGRYLECDQKRIKPVLVSTGPVKETIIRGEQVDLMKLPIPTYSEEDCGSYLTAGVEIARHPETGVQNASIHRRLVLGKDRTTLRARQQQHVGQILQAGEERGVSIGVATVLGAPPELTIASQVKAPMGVDETEIAGAFRGEPLEVVRCETIDVEVPASAEVVIEGIALPGERAADGPFGEYPGDYISLAGVVAPKSWVIKVTAITMRKNPIFQACLTGMPMTENHWLRKWALAAAAWREISRIVPHPQDIKAVNVTAGGAAGRNVVVAINKRTEKLPKDIICTLLSSLPTVTNVIVVDDDVDVYDPFDVERAWATRVVPERDIIILSAGEIPDTMRAKWGIDATMPIRARRWFKKIRVPGVDKVDYV